MPNTMTEKIADMAERSALSTNSLERMLPEWRRKCRARWLHARFRR